MDTPASTSSSSNTLRPRFRRQTHEGEDNAFFAAPLCLPHEDTNPASEISSRATSPIPRALSSQPTLTNEALGSSRSNASFLGVPTLLRTQMTSSTFTTGLWEGSWSSLRGIASDLIGADASRASSPGRSPVRKRRPLEATHGRNTSAPPTRWGPSAPVGNHLASGTAEDRVAKVQAKKREMLLMANGHMTPDSSGRYKRRDSDDRDRSSVPPGKNEDRDALVYLHRVRPEDTLAGVMIKYNCQSSVLQKANRLWPNDSIQVRKIIVLPVDACGVRGRKLSDSELASRKLTEPINEAATLTPKVPRPLWGDVHNASEDKEAPLTSIPTSPSISVPLPNPEEPTWKHDSWVMMDGSPEAIEIARLSRRALGYFPRSRRKSQSYPDLETPSASLELPRSSYQSSSPRQATRSRSGSNPYFATHLQGPGGVGTMSKNVRSPGPANDGLNKLFPTLQPTLAARGSFESQHSNSSHTNGLENVGGAIEGWVRKLANKASASLKPTTTPGGGTGVGDLIELSEDAFDAGEDSQVGSGCRESRRGEGTGSRVGDWSLEQERLLQERFPPRGRVIGEASKRMK